MTYDPAPSMTQKEEDEYVLIYGTRKQRKAIKERQAREQEQKQHKDK